MSEPVYIPFTVYVPEVKPGQGVQTKEITVPVRVEDGYQVMTHEAHETIDRIKMQMLLSRLTEAVRELYEITSKKGTQ